MHLRFSAHVPRRWGFRLLRALVVAYAIVCAGCAAWQRHLIYFPQKFSPEQMDAAGKSENLERWKNTRGENIGWCRPSPSQPSLGRILLTHGNGECAFQDAHYADRIQEALPMDVYILEYPGYADRPGKPTEKSIEAAAADALLSLPPDKPVVLVGSSLGTGVACWLAGQYPARISGVILLAPFTSLVDVGRDRMPWLPVGWILVDRFNSVENLKTYSGPLAVAVAGQDRVVPQKLGRKLFEGYHGPKRLWEFPDEDHGSVMLQPASTWKEFIGFVYPGNSQL
ncbi:MAG: alpha/beta fold hydrolase [Verrucomicrobiota bacterium]